MRSQPPKRDRRAAVYEHSFATSVPRRLAPRGAADAPTKRRLRLDHNGDSRWVDDGWGSAIRAQVLALSSQWNGLAKPSLLARTANAPAGWPAGCLALDAPAQTGRCTTRAICPPEQHRTPSRFQARVVVWRLRIVAGRMLLVEPDSCQHSQPFASQHRLALDEPFILESA